MHVKIEPPFMCSEMALNNQRYTAADLDGSLRIQNRFLVLRKLGQGTYGKVQLALKKETNEEVAVKTIKKCKIENEEDMLRIRREIHIMTSLRHPHIIHINEVFETRQKIVIVMQYASGGELYEYLGCHQKLPEDEARRIFRQIASAIYYCHKNQICHRDLKLENILLDEEGNAQIGDFGLSNIFDDKRRMNTFCGSPLYASPEIVKGTPYKGPEVDCWSLGVLLYTLVYGTMPFDGRSFKELVSQISEGRYDEPANKSNASFLIRWLLTPDISRRATITDVCKDNWINQGYDSNLLEIAEKIALTAGYPREQTSATKLRLENFRETSIFRKTAAQLEEKAATFSSLYTKNFGNIHKTNVASQARKPSNHEQIRNYDVRFVLNKLIAAVETSLNVEKNMKHSTVIKSNRTMEQNKEDLMPKKVDSASVIPIFEVTSTIPNDTKEKSRETKKRTETILKLVPNHASKTFNECHDQRKNILNSKWNKMKDMPEENSLEGSQSENNQEINSIKKLLTDSQMQYHSLSISGKPEMYEADIQTPKLPRDRSVSEPIGLKRKEINDCSPTAQKHPFIRTKHHVLTLARLLSLNYEQLMKNSIRMPTCSKKPPGKITIPPTFDPKISPSQTNKQQEEKKELLIFPTVSVSENKEKIQKKIEKIKKAALDKNIIIRSDSKTRMRIENYIRSQVKKIQDLVREEQSRHASLEHLDEQSLRDMSEMYYCAFGSDHTDSGIANTEDEENFCFLCSKSQDVKGTSKFFDSLDLENIKKKCFYPSNHLHIPKRKGQYASNNSDIGFGSLTRCKSEIKLPIEYLNYISPNKLDLNKKLQNKQQNDRLKYFLTAPFGSKAGNSNLRILRSASESAGLNLSRNAFEVLKIDSQNHDSALQMYTSFSHFLEQTSAGCSYSEMNNYDTHSSAADDTFQNGSKNRLEKDDGIGNSNDSFQSYIDTLENDHNDLSRSLGSFHLNSLKDKSNNNHPFSNYPPGNDYVGEFDDFEREQEITADFLNWKIAFDKEKDFVHDNRLKLGRRNTTACTFDKSGDVKCDQSKSEFQNYLWNAYKEHLLENNQNDTEYSSSPNLNYYSLDRKTKFKNRNCKSMDYLYGEKSNDIPPNAFLDFPTSVEQNSSQLNSTLLENTLKHSKRRLPERSADSLSKLLWSDTLSHTDMDDNVLKLKGESKLFLGNRTRNANNSAQLSYSSNFLNNLEKRDKKLNRNCYSKNNLPHHKRTNSEHKKSFLQLLALKSIKEAEKELQNTHRRDELNVEDETSGSLLEALKSQGYKSVMSQRFQATDNDSLDPFQMKYFKSPAQLRAELAQLNSMYYETLPMCGIDPREESDYLYGDLDYSRWMLSGLATQSLYDMQADFEKQTPKQSVYDWLRVTPIDESIDAKSRVSAYIPEETTPNPEMKRCWARDNYGDESTLESQHVLAESPSFPKKKALGLDENKHSKTGERSHTLAAISDDENQESVHDRIWRKSFYSRFNNRALSRKERSSFREPELLSSENRHGQLSNIHNSSKTLYDKTDLSQWNGSNKSFRTKRSKKHSQSFDKFDFGNIMKKKYSKPENERGNECSTKESFSNKSFTEVCNTDNEEPEH